MSTNGTRASRKPPAQRPAPGRGALWVKPLPPDSCSFPSHLRCTIPVSVCVFILTWDGPRLFRDPAMWFPEPTFQHPVAQCVWMKLTSAFLTKSLGSFPRPLSSTCLS